jgi:8-oxo-dGTP diphosphatase
MDDELSNKLSNRGTDRTCPGIFLFRDGKVLIGLRNYTPDKYKAISVWTIPGGRMDPGETFEETLRRETREETGITDFAIEKFCGMLPGAKEGDVFYGFIGSTSQDAKLMEPEKFSEWRWVSPSDIPENFINPAALKFIR